MHTWTDQFLLKVDFRPSLTHLWHCSCAKCSSRLPLLTQEPQVHIHPLPTEPRQHHPLHTPPHFPFFCNSKFFCATENKPEVSPEETQKNPLGIGTWGGQGPPGKGGSLRKAAQVVLTALNSPAIWHQLSPFQHQNICHYM